MNMNPTSMNIVNIDMEEIELRMLAATLISDEEISEMFTIAERINNYYVWNQVVRVMQSCTLTSKQALKLFTAEDRKKEHNNG